MLGNDHRALGQEAAGDFDGGIQEAAGIAAQIEHQSLDVVLAQILQGSIQLLAGAVAEAQNLHVCDTGMQPESVLHALAADFLAHQRERQVVRRPGA